MNLYDWHEDVYYDKYPEEIPKINLLMGAFYIICFIIIMIGMVD